MVASPCNTLGTKQSKESLGASAPNSRWDWVMWLVGPKGTWNVCSFPKFTPESHLWGKTIDKPLTRIRETNEAKWISATINSSSNSNNSSKAGCEVKEGRFWGLPGSWGAALPREAWKMNVPLPWYQMGKDSCRASEGHTAPKDPLQSSLAHPLAWTADLVSKVGIRLYHRCWAKREWAP